MPGRNLALALGMLACPAAALALDSKIYSPAIVKDELELEYGGTRTFDSHKEKNDLQENQFSIGYGVTDFWKVELDGILARGPGMPQDFVANEFENIFAFSPPGKYWLDTGMLATYQRAAKSGDADSVELKLLLQKDIGRFTTVANLGGHQEVGAHASGSPELGMAINARYRWLAAAQPGIELQSDFGEWSKHAAFSEQSHYLGPSLYGKLLPQLNYEVAYLFGVSQAAASSAMRLKLEYEFYF
ncbi:MAG: hypothetical protein JO089_03420 [Alphaproteobacteria bacterium]|nr:hypothetical protein [Alphaproteobacteria bacterium]